MSQGPIFNLVLRDERFDGYFTASDYLRARLDKIRAERKERGETNVQPTFADIAQSHLVYIRGTYRPYVATASEYVRVKPYGDATGSIGAAGGTLVFNFPIYGHFTSDILLHVRLAAVGTAAPGAVPSPATPYLRYCAFPGLRALRNVSLKSASTVVDEYSRDDAVAWSKHFVGADAQEGWARCLGQQERKVASYFSGTFTGLLNYSDGPQTPKLLQPALDLFIPLQFWFCLDADQALLNDLIPNTQRTITCELAPLGELVQALVPGVGPSSDLLVPAPLPFSRLKLEAVALYVNNLFVNPEIHDIFASRIGFSLIRVHRHQTTAIQNIEDRVLLDQLKFPIEYLLVGLRARANALSFDHWWLMGRAPAFTDATALMIPAMIWNPNVGQCQLVCREGVPVSTLDSFTSHLGLTAHGIPIFPLLPAGFYNAYLPLRFQGGDKAIAVSPADSSAYLVTLCLYPGMFNPSGYYNLSAGRELYLNYRLKGSPADIPGQAEVVVLGSALNFLIRKADVFALKYAM